jgi:hypothetical protein
MPFTYGKPIIYGTATFPHLFSGICESYNYAEAMRRSDVVGENFDFAAVVLDQRKFNLSFTATVTNNAADFFDLSTGAKIAVQSDDIETGTVLCSQAVETWELGKEKTASITATHYPALVEATAGPSAGALSAFTPAGGNGTGVIMFPAGRLRWGLGGMATGFGVINRLTCTQTLTLQEEPDEQGEISTVIAGKFQRTLDLTVASTGDRPPVGELLVLSGAPAHLGGYRIMSSDVAGSTEGKKLFNLNAAWFPLLNETL